jgi:hypothetical protein
VNLRRTLASGAAGLVATAVLAGCGFSYPTDRPYEVNSAANYRDGTVEILNAVVVAKGSDAGTFVATFVNDSLTKSVSLQSVSGDNTAIGQVSAPSLTLAPNSVANLATDGGIPVTGTFDLGQFVSLTFQFDDGEATTLSVPVVADKGQWAGLDNSTPSPTGSATGSPAATGSTESPSASSG